MFRSRESNLSQRTDMFPFDLQAWLLAQAEPPPIVQAGALVLRRRAVDVPADLFGTKALSSLIEIMVRVMREAPGVGLAAPQIGVPLRVFVAEDPEERLAKLSPDARALRRRIALPLLVLVNPTVVATSSEDATFFEGCLSVRGYGALVARASAVDVSGVDAKGWPIALHLEGWPARIMQHEMDHLEGTLYVDRMISRSFACDEELARWSALGAGEARRELVGSQPPPAGRDGR
jgi:peptide deformylase